MYKIYARLPVPVCALNLKYEIVACNHHWESLLGEQDFTNRRIFDLFTEDENKELVLKSFSQALENGESLLIEFSLSNQQKQFFPLSWAIVPDKENGQLLLCAQSSSDKQSLETRFARMYQSTTDAIMLLDGNSFTDCNQSSLDMFKVNTVEDFIKFHPGDLSPEYQPNGKPSFLMANEMIEKAFAKGRNIFDWTHRTAQGEEFPAEVLLSPIQLHGKTYLQASVRDISERVALQKALDEARMYQINSSKLAALGEVAGGIAHEINNPMTVIRIQAESMLKSISRNPNIDVTNLKLGLERIVKTSDRITKIIKGLKLLSRDSTMDPLQLADLHSIILDTLGICEENFRIKNIKLHLNISENTLIHCRPVEISQVLINLISNSVDAIEQTQNPWIKIETYKDDNYVVLKFIDSGNGIPSEIYNKIMQPFYTTKDVGKGSGLGLSITKRIIENHSGEFYLDVDATNTTFVIRLPLQKEGP